MDLPRPEITRQRPCQRSLPGAGHNCWVLPEEEQFLTPEVLRASALIGTAESLRDQLGALSQAGLSQVMILPNFDTRFDVLEDVGRELIGKV